MHGGGVELGTASARRRTASTTIPGDNLYPVKRTWEDLLVLFTFNPQERETLELEHENERLYELQELFAKGRSVEVDFAGVVTNQTGSDWLVSGIPVIVSAQTNLHDPGIVPGSPVRVKGHTQSNGAVLAEEIELLPLSVKVITFELGIRFLADHLNGDAYFRTRFPGHPVLRAGTQLQLNLPFGLDRRTSLAQTTGNIHQAAGVTGHDGLGAVDGLRRLLDAPALLEPLLGPLGLLLGKGPDVAVGRDLRQALGKQVIPGVPFGDFHNVAEPPEFLHILAK